MTSEIFPEPSIPASSNIARRSVSIFSRKGTETPVQITQAFPFSGTNMTSEPPTSPTTSSGKIKSKRWTLGGRGDVKPGGTILRAVPKDAPKTNMTPLEREMATSPNDEILRAIGRTAESAPTSPIGASSPLTDITNVSPQRYYSKRSKHSRHDYLGVWRDGQVQWDKENQKREEALASSRPKTSDGSRCSSSNMEQPKKLTKPKIHVIIPDNHSSKRPFSFIPFFHNGSSENTTTPSVHVVSPPSVTSGMSSASVEVSAITPTAIYRPRPYRPFQPITTSIDQSPAFEGGLVAERPPHSRTISINSSGSDSDGDDNASLVRSSRSSMTSIGVHNEEQRTQKGGDLSRRGSSSSEASFEKDDDSERISKIRVETTIEQTCVKNVAVEGPRMNDMVDLMRSTSTHRRSNSGRKQRLSSSRGQKKLARINSKEELKLNANETLSLDEAVRDLEDSLSSFKYDLDGADAPEVVEQPMSPIPEIVLLPVDAPPALPRKSSKRARLSCPPASTVEAPAPSTNPPKATEPVLSSPDISMPTVKHAPTPPVFSPSNASFTAKMEAARLAQRRQQMQSHRRERRESYGRLRRRSSVRSVLSLVREEDEFQNVDSNAAEQVVFHILSSLDSMDDLFNAALITKGFHYIFKRYELDLMRSTLRKECAPAWEFREACLPVDEDHENSAAPPPDYTPQAYYQGYKSDWATVTALEQLILQHCSSLLRAETIEALQQADCSNVHAALFRIWTFCHIFGSGRGREDDIIAQMDWLRGGVLAHQESCTSTISAHDSFYISTVLLNAPEHFGQGNAGGLSAEELYDILEIWSCLIKLTSGVVGQTQQARQFGIYDRTDVGGGDIDGEEALLEEWHAYLLTLGLVPILDIITALVNGESHSAFAVAQYKGLTTWEPPLLGSSRSAFLHEAVSRLYEERICATFSPEQSHLTELRSIRRARDSELYQRRLSVRSMQYPSRQTSLNREWGSFRSMSGPSATPTSPFNTVPSHPTTNVPLLPPLRPATILPRKPVPHYGSRRGAYYPVDEPIAEELPPYDRRAEAEAERKRMHPLQRALQVEDSDPSQNSADKAVSRIVEMGFTIEEAKGALKITDMGDGLRVDRAVEYLMRAKGFN
ncbi:uncharacterized protein PV09_00321 [Verruconis gallopava]|uniref:UBA domain-containing protein n=1 Tax=Verruconis gallopava TaxID=253628 RepID=A0A0D1Y358_9PEZI|nr:uncharacterized protein PV09_00321 [Verruconis gallopava]KIW09436.1 hypothetical protein PV09_00321 [Verruconis gallopava]